MLISKVNCYHHTVFNEDMVAVHMNKVTVKYDKPLYLGMCILDIRKTFMYRFHYDNNKPNYGDKAKLLFTDIDSVIILQQKIATRIQLMMLKNTLIQVNTIKITQLLRNMVVK